MATLFARFVKLPVSSYLALQGITNCYHREDTPSDSEAERKMWQNGLVFLGLNVLDELKTIMADGGRDEHIHHTVCIAVCYINLRVLGSSTDTNLKTMMIDAFNSLLANEVVAPAFAIYALLSKWKSPQSYIFQKYALRMIAPVLVCRSGNSVRLMSRLIAFKTSNFNTRVFKYSTMLLSMCLVFLDIVWLQWVRSKYSKLLRWSVVNRLH